MLSPEQNCSRNERPTFEQVQHVQAKNTEEFLRALKAHSGKLLLWHGWADGAIMATSSIGYYEAIMQFMHGRQQTEDFFRLFLVMGVHHRGGGPEFTEFDSMTELENWVEKGQAPDKLIAGRLSKGVVEMSPVFP